MPTRAAPGLDQRFCGAQPPTGAGQDPCRFIKVAAFEQQQRGLDIAAGPAERIVHLLTAAARQLQQDLLAAPDQLFVDGLKIDHQSAIDPAEADHHQG